MIEQVLSPLLVGADPRYRRSLWEEMRKCVDVARGKSSAGMVDIGAVDVALWDLYGKLTGEPVWRLLGGYRDRVAVYGALDAMTGGIVNSFVVSAAPGMPASFLTGVVDQVDMAFGTAVVSGVTVDYTALLGNGIAPTVGQTVSFTGWVYGARGLIAEL